MLLVTLLFGIGSWIIPIYSLLEKEYPSNRIIYSLGLALLSLTTLFLSLSSWIEQEDWSAILDTYPTLRVCAILLTVGVIVFNSLYWIKGK